SLPGDLTGYAARSFKDILLGGGPEHKRFKREKGVAVFHFLQHAYSFVDLAFITKKIGQPHIFFRYRSKEELKQAQQFAVMNKIRKFPVDRLNKLIRLLKLPSRGKLFIKLQL